MNPRCSSRLLSTGVLLSLLAGPVAAQDPPRSDTGRRRPEPPPPPPVAESVAATDALAGGKWFLTFGAGLASGTDLFTARSASGNPVLWPGSPFPTADFNAKLDAGLTLNLGLGRRLGPWLRLRGEFTYSDLGVSAESAVGQVGDVFSYDSFGIWSLVVGTEVRLVRLPSAPYLGLGVALQGISAAEADDLSQTNLGGRIALGYLYELNEKTDLRFEGRLTHSGIDMGGHDPETNPPNDVLIDSQTSMSVWELVLGVQMEI